MSNEKLDSVDLSATITKEDFKGEFDILRVKLDSLQRALKDAGVPSVILFEGWNDAIVAKVSGRVISALDPRGYSIYSSEKPSGHERKMPFMWRFWRCIPKKGLISIYDLGWYSRLVSEYSYGSDEYVRGVENVKNFERQLSECGYLVIKIFLHVSKEELILQSRKFDDEFSLKYSYNKSDWSWDDDYDRYYPIINELINQTSTAQDTWNIVSADDRRYATLKACKIIIEAFEKRLLDLKSGGNGSYSSFSYKKSDKFKLPDGTPPNPIDKEEYEKRKEVLDDEIKHLQVELYRRKIPLIVLYEGWDAAGKGGSLTRFAKNLNPHGYRIIPISAPTPEEKSYHFLWRFYQTLSRPGYIRIYDRSWYGRVLVERVEGFCSEEEWQNAYREINEFESQLIDWGAIIVKFWMQISNEEQLTRFNARMNNPEKRYKITDEDWRNREKWSDYEVALSDMFSLTSTPASPWEIVLGNNKYNARIQTLSSIVEAMRAGIMRYDQTRKGKGGK